MLFQTEDSIVAIATPPGIGALAVIRISGASLEGLYFRFTGCYPKNRFALFTRLLHPNKEGVVLDEVIITFFQSPRSFTGEDVIEISCHGGIQVKDSIVNAAIDAGVRPASPGEFSFRSFLNGKIDLLQAEALSSLISSRGRLSSQASLNHLSGTMSNMLQKFKSKIIDTLSILENELNFSENEIDFTSYDTLKSNIKDIQLQLNKILSFSKNRKNVFSGVRVVLYGRTNSGKSSLFNSILDQERSIISSYPGTTRDSIEAWIELAGFPVCLVDTAGVWSADTPLDGLAVKRALKELNSADLLLIVDEEDPGGLLSSPELSNNYSQNYILVKSKSDLSTSTPTLDNKTIETSSLTRSGINTLLTSISTYLSENIEVFHNTDSLIITERQQRLLLAANTHLDDASLQLEENVESDIIASTLHSFIDSLKEVLGEIPNKEILKNIFNNFCIGK